jgi:hypothetical protein
MKNWQINRRIFLIVAAISISFVWNTTGWSHGDETSIVPASLSAKAGGKLKVEVKGLTGTKAAAFSLTGLSGKVDLGQFPISSDDFTQVLDLPADLPPGSYRLTVEGGDKSAKVVITIN